LLYQQAVESTKILPLGAIIYVFNQFTKGFGLGIQLIIQ